jgi:hypothetical protein
VNFYLHPDYSWIEKLETWAIQRWGLTPQIVQELISSSPEEKHPNLEEWIDSRL